MENSFLISQPQGFNMLGQRGNQEDALFPSLDEATSARRVFMVCDGMGGHEHGEVASRCVAETIGTLASAAGECTVELMQQTFEDALDEAYRRLDTLDADGDGRGRTMGTTLTFLAFCTDGVLVAHIGDSRVYLFRRGQGVVFRTRDHSLVEDLIAAGELTPDEARIGGRLAVAFGERFAGGRSPSAERMVRIALGHAGLLVPEPLPVYLSPAVRR